MKNPFVVTGVVQELAFCNRLNEQAELKTHIQNSQNVLLYSHRRHGKTSLILKVFKQLSNVTPIYIDLYGTTSVEDFIKAFIKGVSVVEKKTNRLIKLVRESLSGVAVTFGYDPVSNTPSMSASFSHKPADLDIDVIFQMAKTISQKKKIVIAFDEFQEIANYGGDAFEKKLRKAIQHHDNIAYIFAGSQRHLITAMFNNAKRAFYQMAVSMPLHRINTEDFIEWIQDLYIQAGKSINEMVIRNVVTRCENHPKYIQEFFYTLWPVKAVGLEEVNKVEMLILEKRSIEFMNTWDALSLNQKKALKLIAATSGEGIYSAENLTKHQFKTASQVAAALKALEQRELLSKNGEYRIQDPIFMRWVRNMV